MKKSSVQCFISVFLLSLGACKTSGDVSSRRDSDPSGVKTVESDTRDGEPQAGHDNLKARIAILEGQIEDVLHNSNREQEALKAKIAELEDENTKLKTKLASGGVPAQEPVTVQGELPSDKTGAPLLWELAMKDLRSGQYQGALSPLSELIKQYPKDKRAFEAAVTLAMTQYELAKYKEAALTFNQIIDTHAKNPFLSIAWFGQGAAYARIDSKDDALLFFEQVTTKYPKSAEAKEVKKILAQQTKKSKALKVPTSLFSAFPHWLKTLKP